MALPILDGNQTATTLSTVLTSGEHIPAHTVVSLGANAIANITSAVSGSVVSVSNFPASQSTTFGAVTGSVSVLNFPSTQTVAGTVTANVVGYNSSSNQTGPLNLAFGQESFTDGSRIGVALIDNDGNEFGTNFPLSVAGTVTANLSSSNLNSVTIGIRGTVTVGNSVTISSLPAISGTVTANIGNLGAYSLVDQAIAQGINNYGEQPLFSIPVINESGQSLAISGTVTVGNSVTIGSLPAISGTVTVGNSITIGSLPNFQDHVTDGVNVSYISNATAIVGDSNPPERAVQVAVGGSFDAVSTSNPFPISGTVTANNPSGALTTRFGSVTTANTAQITSAVTNTNRKYLLAQNISAGTVTIGIGFSPTTTQGIQLTAGAGLTFDAFCPTGAVYWLGAVTGAAFTILEG